MQGFRNFLRGTGGKVLLALIIVPFIITAFYGYFTGGGGDQVVAKVGGTPIYRQVLDNRVMEVRARATRETPGLSPQLVERFITPEGVLQGLVNNLVVLTAAQESGLRVGDEQAARLIMQQSLFHDGQGRFSNELFESRVRAAGQTPQGYLAGVREQLLSTQLTATYQDTEFALPWELDDLRRLGDQRRDVRYARLPLAELAQRVDVSQDDIDTYYREQAERFIRPVRYRLEYVELTPSTFVDQVQLNDADVEGELARRAQQRQDEARAAERRRLSQIQVKVGGDEVAASARIQALREQLERGTPFDQLAREASDDLVTRNSGGRLGILGRGALPPELDRVAFSLEKGEVSQVLRSDDAFYLVKVDDVLSTAPQAESEDREAVVAALKEIEAESLLNDAVRRLEEMAFEHPDLTVPAQNLGVTVQRTELFSLTSPVGIAREQAVLEELQDEGVLERGLNSRLITLPDQRFLVVRVAETHPEEPIPVAEVAEEIRLLVQRERATAQLQEIEESLAARLDAGLETLASELSMPVQDLPGLRRGGNDADTSELAQVVFTLSRELAGSGRVVLEHNGAGDLLLLQLVAVTDGDAESLEPGQQQVMLHQLGQQLAGQTFAKVISDLRDEIDVRIYPERLSGTGE